MITEGVTTWLLSKIAPTVAALLGGLSLVMLWTPQKLLEKGKVAAVFIAGAMSATVGFVFSAIALTALGLPISSLDYLIGIGWLLGFFSVAVMNWVVNWIEKKQNKDVFQVASDIKKEI